MESNKQFFIPCSCHSLNHVVSFEIYHYPKHNIKDMQLSFIPRPKGLLEKLKFMWYILIGKDWLFSDMIIDDKYVSILKDVVDYYEQDLSLHDGSKEGVVTQ